MLYEEDYYKAVNSLSETAKRLASQCRRPLTDTELIQCVAEPAGLGKAMEALLKHDRKAFFRRFETYDAYPPAPTICNPRPPML